MNILSTFFSGSAIPTTEKREFTWCNWRFQNETNYYCCYRSGNYMKSQVSAKKLRYLILQCLHNICWLLRDTLWVPLRIHLIGTSTKESTGITISAGYRTVIYIPKLNSFIPAVDWFLAKEDKLHPDARSKCLQNVEGWFNSCALCSSTDYQKKTLKLWTHRAAAVASAAAAKIQAVLHKHTERQRQQ